MAFEAIGTAWSIGFASDESVDIEQIGHEVRERIDIFDKAYSRFRPDSLVTKIAQSAGTYELPEDAAPLMDFYRRMYDVSGGAVTPLIGQVLSDAGYDAAYSLTPGSPLSPPAWDDAMRYEQGRLVTELPVLLDFGAAGKGYLVDIVSNIIERHGVRDYYVDAGGDMYCRRPGDAMPVGLEHPAEPSQAIGVAELRDQALCGSAPNRRQWHGYSHIIDPVTLQSPDKIAAVWAVADTAMEADGMTTCLFFTGAEALTKHFNFEYALLTDDMSLEYSPGFPATFFTETA